MTSAGKTRFRSLCRLLLPLLLMAPTSAPAEETDDFDLHMSRFPPVRKEIQSDQQHPSSSASDAGTRAYPSTGSPSAISNDRVPQTGPSSELPSDSYPDTGAPSPFSNVPVRWNNGYRRTTPAQPVLIPNSLDAPSPSTAPTNSESSSDADDASDERKPIGPKPPEDANELLARDTNLLFKPGDVQTEVGVLYTRQEAPAITVLPDGTPVLERIRSRSFIVPFSLRYGLSKKIELFTAVPLGLSLFERDNVITESHEEAGMLGDITAGFVYQIPETRFPLPDTTFSFNVTTPTSSSSVSTISGDQATLGNGVWKLGGGSTSSNRLTPSCSSVAWATNTSFRRTAMASTSNAAMHSTATSEPVSP